MFLKWIFVRHVNSVLRALLLVK